MKVPVVCSEEVFAALAAGRPVVALETAVLTHGLAPADRLPVFAAMEAAVRAEGAVPAAVAVLGGALRAGLAPLAVERLAEGGAAKAGLADLPALLGRGADAGTTVAATLWAARAAGIPVFATGGLGGVHRGAEATFDVSGDLGALARFGGCVVCSGAKAVLDLPKTLELLEALGVCVVGYRTTAFPAFVGVDSGLSLGHRVDTPTEVAAVLRARDALGLPQAVVVANPPPEAVAVPRPVLVAALAEALREAAAEGVAGPGVTPFLLASLARQTAGASVAANRALLVDNARLAARIARARSLTAAPALVESFQAVSP